MKLRSILKPDQSVVAALATVGTVYAIYNMSAGSIAQAHDTDPNHPALESSRKKAGYSSFVLVSGLFLITRDGNIATLGYGSIIAAEILYRHGIMANVQTGKMQPPDSSDYLNAGDPTNTGGVNLAPVPDDVTQVA